MGVLVEDLLTLARLDEIADAPHAELDLAALAGDAVDDARATAPDREIALRRRRRRPCSATPTSCARCSATCCATRSCTRRRARRSRCPSARGPDVVRVTVRDHGPGLPTDDPDALFERFWRAEGGRERGQGGAGLGLAIVAGDRRRPRRPRARAQRRRRRRGVRRRAARSQEPLSRLRGSSTRRGPSAVGMTSLDPAPDHRAAPPAPRARRRDRRARSTTRRPRWSAASAACTASSPTEFPFSWRIVIADNASTDATPAIAARLAGHAARRRARCGSSARAAAARCAPPGRPREARVVAYMDVDLSTDLRGLLPLVAPLLSGHSDLAIGTRLAHGARVVRGPKRELISRAYNSILHTVAARPLQRRAVRLQGRPHRRARRGLLDDGPRRRLVLRHRAARARPAARAADPRGAGRLGRRPRLARGDRPHRARRPARRRAAGRGRAARPLPRRSAW